MSDAVRLVGLTKDYGRHRVLDNVDLAIGEGEVFGYFGSNGAGKTTTIRLLLGLLRPTLGSAQVFGLDAWRDSVRIHARTGYLPGEPGLYDRMTGRAVVEYFAALRGRRGDVVHALELAGRLKVLAPAPAEAVALSPVHRPRSAAGGRLREQRRHRRAVDRRAPRPRRGCLPTPRRCDVRIKESMSLEYNVWPWTNKT